MQCRYVAVFVAQAIALPSGQDTVQVYDDSTERVSAVLTNDPSELLAPADRGSAIANILLRGVFGSSDPRQIEEKLQERIETIRDERKQLAGTAPFLIAFVDTDIAPVFREPHRDEPDYSLYFDAINKDEIRAAARPNADHVLAALILASETEPQFDRVGEWVYLLGDDGRVTYSLTAKMGAPSLLVRRLVANLPEIVARYVSASRRRGRLDLTTVYSLLRAAVDGGIEPLRGFIAAWSALEIFTNKVFSAYERLWFDQLAAGRSPSELKHFGRIREVMKGKYRLLDMFTVVAVTLSPDSADEDINEFANLKETRDELFHGGILNESQLPAHRALALARRYLRLHIEKAMNRGTQSATNS